MPSDAASFWNGCFLRLIDFKRGPYFGSDHFPVQICLNFESDAEHTQEEPTPNPDQLAEAHEVIQEKLGEIYEKS